MSVLSKIGGFIFGKSDTSRDLFDRENGHLKNFGSWVGNLKFTTEEMAELDAETAAGVRKFAIETLEENTERSKTRRDLALFVIRFWALMLFWSAVVYPFDSDWSAMVFSVATLPQLGALVAGVGLFHWGTHTMRSYQDKKSGS